MTYTIPPGTPKAQKAAEFGREMAKALAARNVSINELGRVTGVGATSLDNYRCGRILPKVAVAQSIAATLRWPRLAEMIAAARTFQCARKGCPRTFRNDTGAPRKYCSQDCQLLNNKLADAAASNRAAGRAGVWSSHDSAVVRRVKAAMKIADERLAVLTDAIAAMCAGCEPEGLCRTAECPLRAHSPLPLSEYVIADARTNAAIRKAMWTPERHASQQALLERRWSDPAFRERMSETMRRDWAEHPERADAVREGVRRRDERRRSASTSGVSGREGTG